MDHLGTKLRATIFLLLFISATACGGSKQAAEAPADAAVTEAGGSADAADAGGGDGAAEEDDPESAFAEAEKELEALLGGATERQKQPTNQPGSTPTPMTDDDDDGEEIVALDRANRCTTACKALASMRRSAERVCSMTGDEDPRCENLRERVERARTRVYANCPSCVAAKP